MRIVIAWIAGGLLLGACQSNEKTAEVTATAPETVARVMTEPATETAVAETAATETAATGTTDTADSNFVRETYAGQIKVAQPVSMFNYVGAESGDFAPMRFRNDSPEGRKILAVCADDDQCEFTGVVEWLDETPPENASAIGRIVSVDSVRKLPPSR